MRPDLASGGLWLAAGVFVAWEGRDLGIGSASDPGSGFVLFGAGLLLAALAVVQVAVALAPGAAGPVPSCQGAVSQGAGWQGTGWRKPLLAVAVLAAYAAALLPLGFLLSTAAFLLVLFLAIEPTRPPLAAALAVGTAVLVWVAFVHWLGVPLPRGILAF